jgi:hypothetical protein
MSFPVDVTHKVCATEPVLKLGKFDTPLNVAVPFTDNAPTDMAFEPVVNAQLLLSLKTDVAARGPPGRTAAQFWVA